MKINLIKTANGKFWPADEEAETWRSEIVEVSDCAAKPDTTAIVTIARQWTGDPDDDSGVIDVTCRTSVVAWQ